MKNKIKLISILGLSFVIVNYFLNYQSPEIMVRDLRLRLTNNRLYSSIYKKFVRQKPLVNIPGKAKVDAIVIYSKAKEKMVVDYKGKKLEIWTDNPDKVVLDKDKLEFFYQLQLLREKNKK